MRNVPDELRANAVFFAAPVEGAYYRGGINALQLQVTKVSVDPTPV
jgi:hypothetical protein